MNSQNMINQLNLTASHMLAQFGIVYIFSASTNKVFGATFKLEKDRSSFNFTVQWNITISEISSGGFTGAYIVSDTYNSQLIAFLNGKAFYINTQVTKNSPTTPPIYVASNFDFNLFGTIRYIDAYYGTLVILTTDELVLYTLGVASISNARPVIDGDFNIIDGILDLRDFELSPDRTQYYNTIHPISSLKIYPYKDYFYNFNISLNTQIASLARQRITSNLFFIADSQKVWVFDFSLLKSDVTKGKLPHPIEVSNVISVRRYKESLYLLRSTTNDLNSLAVEVVEVFLLANSVSSWSDPDTSSSDLYYTNNVFLTEFNITEIFVDDVYVYMQGETKMAVAYRGKPSKYSTAQAEVFRGETHEGIGDIGKVLVDGFGVYFALLNSKPTCFNMSIAQVSVSCPVSPSNFNFGDYIVQFNTTTSTCPKKNTLLSSTLDVKGTLSKACLLQKNLVVNYAGIRLPKFGNSSSTDKNKAEEESATQKIMYWFYGALAIFLVVLAVGIVYMCIKRKTQKVQPTTNPVEVVEAVEAMEGGKTGTYNIQHVVNRDTDFSPSDRVTLNTLGTLGALSEARLADPESPLKRR